MLQVYSDIYTQGIEAFEENFLNNFELYDAVTIHTLLFLSIEQTLFLNKIQKIILDKWKKKGWVSHYYHKTNSINDTWVKEIVLVSIEDKKEVSYFIQKQYSSLALQKGLIVFVKFIHEKFFELLCYDNNSYKECKVIIGKYPSNYELDVFIFIKNSLELIKTENIENIELIKIFFRLLNISDIYISEKEQLSYFVINHESSKESGMLELYQYINKFGIKNFEKNLLNKFELYDKKVVDMLFSINGISTLDNINKVISKKREKNNKKKLEKIENKLNRKDKNSNPTPKKYKQQINKQGKATLNSQKYNTKNKKVYFAYLKDEKQQNIELLFNKNQDKTNLKRNRKGWKGISRYKSKRELIFFEKGKA